MKVVYVDAYGTERIDEFDSTRFKADVTEGILVVKNTTTGRPEASYAPKVWRRTYE